MRLNKYIARAGIASRRKADELTVNGQIKINGAVMTEPGYDVQDGDVVEVGGRVIAPSDSEKKVYIMLNKPKGYITTTSDDKGRMTVMELVRDIPERVYPVGRLDYNTTGLLLMTNDGDLANRLTHPSHEVPKTYRAKVSGTLSKERLWKLRNGVEIDGFMTSPAEVTVVKQHPHYSDVQITIHEGRNRQIRKMFKEVGCHVQELKRVAMGDVYLARLAEGQYRKLTKKEIDFLMKA